MLTTDEPKRQHSVQASRLVQEHFGTIMAFAYSRKPLQQLVKDNYMGSWKYLQKALFEIAEDKATRALLELGLYIRVIDDDEKSTGRMSGMILGEVVDAAGFRTPLSAREVAK